MRVAELPQPERAAELERVCGADSSLRADVEALLAADGNAAAAGFMSDPTRSVAAAASASAASASSLVEKPGTRIGRFKLLQQIGEGGFGVVFMADQSEPVRRRVALKIIKLGMDTKQVVARFEQERQALALMDHPNIAKVLDAGATETGRPYFVMEYVVGDRITDFADAHRLSVRHRLDLFSQVCSAIQHAHQKGIIHRDLKPNNVLVSMVDGKAFAKVIDFGIAKATSAQLTDKTLFTEHRQLIGTPEYMSPEQAEGSADIDTRTDVYALGVLLYELLTGATPFDGKRLRSAAFGEMQRIIKEEEPPAPSLRLSRDLSTLAAAAAARNIEPGRLGTVVRGELDWIVMKALEKDRGRRYDGPSALAADVQRHLSGEPVVAAPPSAAYRARKFVRRYRKPVLAGSAVAAALIVGLGLATWQWREARAANAQLREQWQIAGDALSQIVSDGTDGNMTIESAYEPSESEHENAVRQIASVAVGQMRKAKKVNAQLKEQRDTAEWNAYAANIALAQLEMANGNWPAARERLAECPESMRGWEWEFLGRQAESVELEFPDAFLLAGFSPDGSRILTVSWDDIARIVDAASGAQLAELKGHIARVRSAAFSPDSRRIVTASDDKTARIWDAATGAEVVELKGHTESVRSAVFSPDSSRVVTASEDKTARIWDAATGTQLDELGGHASGVDTASFSSNGSRIVTVSGDGIARVWDASTGAELAAFKGSFGAFSPDDARVVTMSGDTARVGDVATGAEVAALKGHTGQVRSAVFSPDGRRIVTASDDETARIWDAATGAQLAEITGHTSYVWAAAFNSDGSRILTASSDNTARIWDSATGAPVSEREALPVASCGAVFSPNGSRVVLRLERPWDDVANIIVAPFPRPDSPMRMVWSALPLVRRALLGSSPGLSIANGRRLEIDERVLRLIDTRLAPDRSSNQGSVDNAHPPRQVASISMHEPIVDAVFTADGTRIFVTFRSGRGMVLDARSAEARNDDFLAREAERVPAAAYVERLLAGPLPTNKLDVVLGTDESLTPLRRLVAIEVLQERWERINCEVASAMKAITEDQSDPASVVAAASDLDLTSRVKELVIAQAAKWKPPAPSAERKLVEAADLAMKVVEATGEGSSEESGYELAVRLLRSALGPNHPSTLEAEFWQHLFFPDRSESNNPDLNDLSNRIDAYARVGDSATVGRMYWSVANALMFQGRGKEGRQWAKRVPATHSLAAFDNGTWDGAVSAFWLQALSKQSVPNTDVEAAIGELEAIIGDHKESDLVAMVLALARYRHNDHGSAVTLSESVRESKTSFNGVKVAEFGLLIRAMAECKQGQTQESNAAFAQLQALPQTLERQNNEDWRRMLDEARKLIDRHAAPPDAAASAK